MRLEGRVLGGRYEVGSPIGAGGMARVYRGTDRVLDRTVAIKVLSASLEADAGVVERFQREARSAAGLTHPNVVSVFDTGSDEGVHYIVMEYVQGETLAQLIRREGALAPRRSAEVAGAVCEALAAAHDAGLVHRDVKPGNVMIGRDGRVKVMDFGIARALAAETLTRTGTTLGTAAYLSPEQARGDQADARSDLYSVGCTVYEMLTGRPPFVGDMPAVVASRHLTEEPQPPSAVRPCLPAGLDAVVMKALAKDPSARYHDARSMGEDVRRAASGLPLDSPPSVDGGMPTAELGEELTEALPQDRTPVLSAAAAPPTSERFAQSLHRRGAVVAGATLGGLALLVLILFLALNSGGSRAPDGETTTPSVSTPTPSASGPSPTLAQALANLSEVVTAGEQADQMNPGAGNQILHGAQDIVRTAQDGHVDEALDKLSDLQTEVDELVQTGKITSASRATAIRDAIQALGQALQTAP